MRSQEIVSYQALKIQILQILGEKDHDSRQMLCVAISI